MFEAFTPNKKRKVEKVNIEYEKEHLDDAPDMERYMLRDYPMDSDDIPSDIANEDDKPKHEDVRLKKYQFDLINDQPKVVRYMKQPKPKP